VFNYWNFGAWIMEGMVEATLLTVMTFFVIGGIAVNGEGYSSSFWLVGVVVYTTVIFVVTFKLSTHTRFWSAILIWVILLTSLGLYLAYTWISNYTFSKYI
jgi:phospholipid-transporting ATPase